MKALVCDDEKVPESGWLVVSICHLSPAAPTIGSVILHAEPLSNQYPVGVVVSAWLADAPILVEVRVGAVGEPPADTEYERVSSNW